MKYKLLNDDTIQHAGKTLYRIVSLKEFGPIKEGELGGYVENDKILSQSGECWISDNAKVFGRSKVIDNARVFGNAIVEESVISGSSVVRDNAVVRNSKIYNDFCILDEANLNFAELNGSGFVLHRAKIDKVWLQYFDMIIGLDSVITKNTDVRVITIGWDTMTFCKDSVCGINIGNSDWESKTLDEAINSIHKFNSLDKKYKHKEEFLEYVKVVKEFLK